MDVYSLNKPFFRLFWFWLCLNHYWVVPAQSLRSIPLQLQPHSGQYDRGVVVQLSAPAELELFYTINGARPDRFAIRYSEPFALRQTAMVRVVAYRGEERVAERGATYLINEPVSNLPTLSIGTDPDRLFHPSRGLFVDGPKVRKNHPYRPGANYWSRKRWPVYLDFWEATGDSIFSHTVDARIFGGVSRTFPQKSLSFSASDQYGVDRIGNYPLGREGPKKVQHLVLRNAGSDFSRAHLRDLLTSRVCRNWPVTTQLGRSVRVYLNGQYWGLYHLREKINPDFLAEHFSIDKYALDLLEHRWSVKHGSDTHYRHLLAFLQQHDLADPMVYDQVGTMMDIKSFLHHQVVQVFIDNRDAGGNIRFWRPQRPDGRWQWLLFDTDYGYGLHDPNSYQFNTLALLSEPDGPDWPNPPWSTFLFRKLLEQPHFRQAFQQRFAEALATVFHPTNAERQLDSLIQVLEPEMERHLKRWELPRSFWYQQIERIRHFLRERPYYVREHLSQFFGTAAWIPLKLGVEGEGHLTVNGYRYEGLALQTINYPIGGTVQLTATPNYGYQFIGWEGDLNTHQGQPYGQLQLDQLRPYRVTAHFEPLPGPLPDALQINEVCPHHRETGDWIELYHAGTDTLQLAGWELRDDRNRFELPNCVVPPQTYVLIAREPKRFRDRYPFLEPVLGPLSFGINRQSERLQLIRPDGQVVSKVQYHFERPGKNFTYARDTRGRWRKDTGYGTPGALTPQGWWGKFDIAQVKRIRLMVVCLLIITLALWWRKRRSPLKHQPPPDASDRPGPPEKPIGRRGRFQARDKRN